jgi:hypothetical protein
MFRSWPIGRNFIPTELHKSCQSIVRRQKGWHFRPFSSEDAENYCAVILLLAERYLAREHLKQITTLSILLYVFRKSKENRTSTINMEKAYMSLARVKKTTGSFVSLYSSTSSSEIFAS